MARVPLEQYLDLEAGVADALERVWRAHVEKLLEPLETAIVRDDMPEAHSLIESIDLQLIAQDARDALEAHVFLSLTYGAMLGADGDARIRYEDRPIPQVVEEALASFMQAMVTAKQTAKDGVLAIIDPQMGLGASQSSFDAEDPQSLVAAMFQMLFKGEPSIAEKINAVVMGQARRAIDIPSNLTTSRLVGLGFLEQMITQGYGTYQVSSALDDRVCPVCRTMHGKIFDVAPARDHLMSVLKTTDRDRLKQISPFVPATKQNVGRLRKMTAAEIQGEGIHAPPYHPGCRCRQVKIGSVPDGEILPVEVASNLFAAMKNKDSKIPVDGPEE